MKKHDHIWIERNGEKFSITHLEDEYRIEISFPGDKGAVASLDDNQMIQIAEWILSHKIAMPLNYNDTLN